MIGIVGILLPSSASTGMIDDWRPVVIMSMKPSLGMRTRTSLSAEREKRGTDEALPV
jgi:hypothetical protein